jgi:hypothetical protein
MTYTQTTTGTGTTTAIVLGPQMPISANGTVTNTQTLTFGGGIIGVIGTGTATSTTTNTALGSLTGISSTVTNTATNTLTGTGSADSVAVFNGLLGLRTGSIKDNPSTGVDVEAAVAIGEGTDAFPTVGKRLVLVYASDDTAKIIAEDFGTRTLKALQLFSASGLYLQGGIGFLRITDTYSEFNQPISAPNLTLAGHGIADLWKPTSVCATGQVMTYLTDNGVPTCVINGTGSGIGCSGGACTYGNWARFTDTTHIEGVAAPTWSSVGADQSGAAAAVQSNLDAVAGKVVAVSGDTPDVLYNRVVAGAGISTNIIGSAPNRQVQVSLSGGPLPVMYTGPASATSIHHSSGWVTVASYTAAGAYMHITGDATFFCTFATSSSPFRVYARILVAGSLVGPQIEIDVSQLENLYRKRWSLSRVGSVGTSSTIELQMAADEPVTGDGGTCTVDVNNAVLTASKF